MVNDNAHILELKELVDTLPSEKRIPLLRFLAAKCDDRWLVSQLLAIAANLSSVEEDSLTLTMALRDQFRKCKKEIK